MITTKKERFEMIDMLTKELPVLRAKAKLSQEEVAERIGISRQTLSSIETEKCRGQRFGHLLLSFKTTRIRNNCSIK